MATSSTTRKISDPAATDLLPPKVLDTKKGSKLENLGIALAVLGAITVFVGGLAPLGNLKNILITVGAGFGASVVGGGILVAQKAAGLFNSCMGKKEHDDR